MASFNKVILLGNLTKDPELKKTPSGVSVARLRLAVNETFSDRQSGQPKEVVCYVDISVWDRQAESCGKYLQRGSQILVEGRLIYDEWKNQQGETRSRISVRADRVQFLNTNSQRPANGQGLSANDPMRTQGGEGTPSASSSAPAPREASQASSYEGENIGGDDGDLPF